MSIITRGYTSNNYQEVADCIHMLMVAANNAEDLIHESIAVDDPSTYTRSWFAWANSFFGEFIIKIMEDPIL